MSSSSHLFRSKSVSVRVPFQDIKEATNNFTTVIRKDEFVTLYKGELILSGDQLTTVTIKRLNRNVSYYGSKEFKTEIDMFSRYKHTNVVSLLGFCDEDDEKILVFNHAEHGSLDESLSKNKDPLTWTQRIDICINAARGLYYLHEEAGVSHGDVKSSNVMLGQNRKAMIANLGLSKIRDAFNLFASFSEPGWGRKGSVDPEYRRKEKGPKTSDIYAFGLVLFEVLCGRSQVAPLAKNYYQDGRLNEIIDVSLKSDQVDSESINMFSEIACRCLQSDDKQRPTMGLVVKKLEHILFMQGILSHVQDVKYLMIPLEDILFATDYFSAGHYIGSGGYADVYIAELKMKSNDDELHETSNTVAIKRIFIREDGKGKEGFISEVDVLSRYKHPNIVSLLGFCVEGNEMLLVYEHLYNGSLDNCLEDIHKMHSLTWAQRLKMCIAIAQGLEYLHTTTKFKKRIIHRDIKSANILISENWEAKIADFGLSILHPGNQGVSTINTKTLAGTEFYVDPEYAKTGRLKKASDIYSLGVVLFEIFSGKLAYDTSYIKKNKKGLVSLVRRHFKSGTIKEILDPKIMVDAYELGYTGKIEPDQDSLDIFCKIAFQCLAKTQVERPPIKAVIDELQKALQFQENQVKSLKFSLENIRSGARNFIDDNCIMRGGYGILYKGKVESSNKYKKVVVKRFSDDRYFLKEFELLFKYKHGNIIGLVGYGKEMDEKIILYEDASMGSLNRYLNDISFSWTKRLKICIDIANGLRFLHNGDLGQDVVIHRDMKSSNIILNKDWKAKICGFELALTHPTNQEMEHVINDVLGSPGYCDPLYRETHTLTKESDIYSFGVILFEILCGRSACLDALTDDSQFLDVLVKRYFQLSQLDEIVFEGIKGQIALQSFATFGRIAFQCLHIKREERPTAGDIVVELQKSLEFQEAYERREAELKSNYEEILQFSNSPEIYSTMAKTYINDIISRGILVEDDKQEIIRNIQRTTRDLVAGPALNGCRVDDRAIFRFFWGTNFIQKFLRLWGNFFPTRVRHLNSQSPPCLEESVQVIREDENDPLQSC